MTRPATWPTGPTTPCFRPSASTTSNQLTTVGRDGTLTVAGSVATGATNVTVNTLMADRYADGTFARTNLSLADGANTFTAVAKDAQGRGDTNAVTLSLPASANFSYDDNGNLVSDGLRAFAYDDENQLVSVLKTNDFRSDFAYDGKMRRRVRLESVWQNNQWVTNLMVRYIYDGMLVVQERHYDPRTSTLVPQLVVTYTRGPDLSGSLQGAGGIGGLLARTESNPFGPAQEPSTAFYFSDNVGNVTSLAGTNGQVLARYVYDPFGNIIAMGGALAERNLYRFSSKEWHANSGLIYYGFRYYNPSLQRWLTKDPMQEDGGINLYTFVANDPVGKSDAFGLAYWVTTRVTDVNATYPWPACPSGVAYGEIVQQTEYRFEFHGRYYWATGRIRTVFQFWRCAPCGTGVLV